MNEDINLPMMQTLLDALPVPVQLYQPEGLMIATNRASEAFWGAPRDVLVGQFNMLTDSQNIELGVPAIFERVIQGEVVQLPPAFYDSTQLEGMEQSGSARWVTVTYFPVTDPAGQLQAIGVMHRDVSSEMAQQASIEVAQQEIASQRSLIASLEAAQRQIQEQASIIRELSSPISQIWEGVLVAPVVGSLDANRATMITENLLEAIVQYQADIVILDITGVPLVDTQVASYLVTTTSACKLLGSRVVLVGIGGEIAQTIVHLGVDLTGIITLSDLRAGILWAFERLGLQVTRQLAPVAHQQRATSARGVAKKG